MFSPEVLQRADQSIASSPSRVVYLQVAINVNLATLAIINGVVY